jgi:hypothetical protein
MLYNATKRELLEGLIVAELISKRGQGPLARRHFPMGERGPASGVRSIGARRKQPAGAHATGSGGGTPVPRALDTSAREPEQVSVPGEADDTPEPAGQAAAGSVAGRSGTDANGEDDSKEPG